MNLFDFIELLFRKKSNWWAIPDQEKKKCFFMVQRLLSIKYPEFADKFNRIGINQALALDFWHLYLSRTFVGVPSFMKTATKARRDQKKSKSIKLPDKDDISRYMEFHRLGTKDLDDLLMFEREGTVEDIKDFAKKWKEANNGS